ncbi:transposase [Streptomyces brevispora]|uniref:transposase n=1 Tax=Streptomyces brevispora TaxID=887462 RepID=UPI00372426D4
MGSRTPQSCVFADDLDADEAGELTDRWISKAQRSQLPAFVKVAKTIRMFRDGILASTRLKINNGRAEGLNNHVRLLTRRANGFHAATAALALVMLACGPIALALPHEHPRARSGRPTSMPGEPNFGGHSTFGVSGPSHSPAAVMGS